MKNSIVHPPLKRALIFQFKYEEAKNLEDIRKRFEKWYCILKPREDLIVMRSLAEEGPPRVIFLISEKSEEGGEIILVETGDSWYTYEKIVSLIRIFCKNAGIKLKESIA